MKEIITRSQAIERGLNRYYTGEPCKHGHVEERVTTSATCIVCMRVATAANRNRARAAIQAKRQAG